MTKHDMADRNSVPGRSIDHRESFWLSPSDASLTDVRDSTRRKTNRYRSITRIAGTGTTLRMHNSRNARGNVWWKGRTRKLDRESENS